MDVESKKALNKMQNEKNESQYIFARFLFIVQVSKFKLTSAFLKQICFLFHFLYLSLAFQILSYYNLITFYTYHPNASGSMKIDLEIDAHYFIILNEVYSFKSIAQ